MVKFLTKTGKQFEHLEFSSGLNTVFGFEAKLDFMQIKHLIVKENYIESFLEQTDFQYLPSLKTLELDDSRSSVPAITTFLEKLGP